MIFNVMTNSNLKYNFLINMKMSSVINFFICLLLALPANTTGNVLYYLLLCKHFMIFLG